MTNNEFYIKKRDEHYKSYIEAKNKGDVVDERKHHREYENYNQMVNKNEQKI